MDIAIHCTPYLIISSILPLNMEVPLKDSKNISEILNLEMSFRHGSTGLAEALVGGWRLAGGGGAGRHRWKESVGSNLPIFLSNLHGTWSPVSWSSDFPTLAMNAKIKYLRMLCSVFVCWLLDVIILGWVEVMFLTLWINVQDWLFYNCSISTVPNISLKLNTGSNLGVILLSMRKPYGYSPESSGVILT